MTYATADELAEALHIRVTPANSAVLEACLAAAAEEIDHDLDRGDEPLPVPPPAAVSRCNVNRAVEWFKAADLAFGAAGFEQTGRLTAPPDPFDRHAMTITQHKIGWAIA